MQHQKQTSRRNFLKILAVGAVSAGVGLKFGLDQWLPAPAATATRLLMGTVVNLTIISDDQSAAQAAIETTLNRMADLEAQLSRHRPDSQLSLLNQNGELSNAGQPLLELISQSRQLSDLSGGAFDITVLPLVKLYQQHQAANQLPSDAEIQETLDLVDYRQISVEGQRVCFNRPGMSITLDGIAKGYIVDEGVAVLKQAGFGDVLVEAGGDLLASGRKSMDEAWQVGVQSPRDSRPGLLGRFEVENKAAATSGDYMQPFTADFRQHHILDPRTGYSAPELASVTVTAPSAMLADGLATAVMALGPQAGSAIIERLPGCEFCLVSKELKIVQTKALL